MSNIERDEGECCPKCGKPSASPPAEVYCVECATEGWQEDAIAHLRHQLAGAVSRELADMMLGTLDAIWTGAMDGNAPDPAALKERIDWYTARLGGQ